GRLWCWASVNTEGTGCGQAHLKVLALQNQGLVESLLLDTEFLRISHFSHRRCQSLPSSTLPQPPAALLPRGGRPKELRRRVRLVRAQGPRPRPRGRPAQATVLPVQPRSPAAWPRPWPGPTRRRRRLSAERRGGAGRLGGQAGGRGRGGRGRAGTGGGPTASQPRPPRAHTGPGSRGRQRGPGEREEPAKRAACRWRPGPQRSASTRPGRGAQAPVKMVSWMISRAVVLVFGMLYPAYYSYKAVKTKNVKEYVRWMMYWIVFALYTVIETVADQTVAWFPLYYELKIAFVVWLLSPYTKGASLIYRKFLHPLLSSKEREIDDYIVQAKERGYETMVNFGRQGLNLAATAAVTAAVKVMEFH
uniref:Receptor expression-enhancing protein n=1 Tax=Macaca mulatta TaxID=9544 RepID=A0A5K1UY10_MACMU